MNKDFRVSVTVATHHKTIKLMRRLGDRSFYNLIRLWSYVATNKPSGDLSCMTVEDIEIASDWTGKSGCFVEQLCDLKFIDGTEGKYSIHDWESHNGFASGATERSDKARFSRMAETHPVIYNRLKKSGVDRISSKRFKIETRVNETLTKRITNVNER